MGEPQFDFQKELARIDRDREEMREFVAEQHRRLAKAEKFNFDLWFMIGGAIIVALTFRLPEILHAFGVCT